MTSQSYTPTRQQWKPRALQEMWQYGGWWEPVCPRASVWQSTTMQIKSTATSALPEICGVCGKGSGPSWTTRIHNVPPTLTQMPPSQIHSTPPMYRTLHQRGHLPVLQKTGNSTCPQHTWGRRSPESTLEKLWDPTTSLGECSEISQLVLTDIFKISLSQAVLQVYHHHASMTTVPSHSHQSSWSASSVWSWVTSGPVSSPQWTRCRFSTTPTHPLRMWSHLALSQLGKKNT